MRPPPFTLQSHAPSAITTPQYYFAVDGVSAKAAASLLMKSAVASSVVANSQGRFIEYLHNIMRFHLVRATSTVTVIAVARRAKCRKQPL